MSKHWERKNNKKDFYTIVDIYNSFPAKEAIHYYDFRRILLSFNTLLSEAVIETGFRYILPERTGSLQIARKKNATHVAYFKETPTVFKNLHSDGYYAHWFWDKTYPQVNAKYRGLVEFTPTRQNKRDLSKVLIEKNYINKYYGHA